MKSLSFNLFKSMLKENPEDFSWKVLNNSNGASILGSENFPVSRFALWGMRHVISPETLLSSRCSINFIAVLPVIISASKFSSPLPCLSPISIPMRYIVRTKRIKQDRLTARATA